jgi:hypothetical protein
MNTTTMEKQDQSCGNCIYYKLRMNFSECRRHPPTVRAVKGFDDSTSVHRECWVPKTMFPNVESYGWCGEWRGKSEEG